MKPKNLYSLEQGMYIVRTKAGFRRASKLHRASSAVSVENLIEPPSYPSLVVFGEGYRGYHFLTARSIHLNEAISTIKQSEEDAGVKWQ